LSMPFFQEGVWMKSNEWFRGFHEEFSTLQKMVSVGKAGWKLDSPFLSITAYGQRGLPLQ